MGARVHVTSEYDFRSTQYGSVTTDARGRFSISGVPDGKKYLYVFGNQPAFWVAGVTPFEMVGAGTTAPDTYLCKSFDLVSPKKDESVSSSRPALRWESYPDAIDYSVRVIRVGQPNYTFSRGDSDPHTRATDVQVDVDLPPGEYRWRVDAFNTAGHIIGCSNYLQHSFRVPSPSDAPSTFDQTPVPSSRPAPVPAPFVQSGNVLAITTAVGQDGTRYQFEIPEKRADTLPPWDQRAASEPPLSMTEARRIAEAWLTSRTPEIKTFELSGLSLVKVPPRLPTGPCAAGGCWYYRASFDPVVGGRRLSGGGDFTVVVLLDGSIVEPRVEQRPAAGTGGAGGGAGSRSSTEQNAGLDNAAGVYRPGNGVTPPRVVRQVATQYTDAARRARVQGSVLVECVVNTDGTVGNVKVVRSLDSVYGLDEEAVKAATQWRFTPGTRMGEPVPVLVTLEMTFSLR
jgi:TonB family protein